MADLGATSKAELSNPGNSEWIKRAFAPRTPKEFFKPNSFRASKDDLSRWGAMGDLAAGPVRVWLKEPPVVRGARRGDHETRYLELWSPRRVVLISGVQTEFTKVGSKSSVGAGVRQAQTGDQAPIWVSKLGAVV